MKLLTADQMRDLDRRAMAECGIPGPVLMENAGRSAAEQLHLRFSQCFPGPVLVLAGKGNNGGDGLVITRHLRLRGWQVQTLVLAPADSVRGDAAINLGILQRSAAPVICVNSVEELQQALAGCSAKVVVDALFGTGLNHEVSGLAALAMEWLRDYGAKILAVDISSGVEASSGRVLGRAVRADLTVTFAEAKLGHLLYPGGDLTGELVVVDIGIPREVPARCNHYLLDRAEFRALLPPRPTTGHKGTFGHLLVVAGSRGKSGAAAMTAMGGQRAGAGLVTAACPRSVHEILAIKLTEAMTAPLEDLGGALALSAYPEIRTLWEGKGALALGPGLGQGAESQVLVRRLVQDCPLPLVLDADGLNALAGHCAILRERPPATTVLTPHPGEMARLLQTTVAAVEADRIGVARDFAQRYQVVLLLKGARTVIADPQGIVFINGSGNAGLASGGMGDVLTGLVGGLLAQGLPGAAAAGVAAFLHGHAADRLSQRFGDAGMTATDLLQEIPAARNELLTQGEAHAAS